MKKLLLSTIIIACFGLSLIAQSNKTNDFQKDYDLFLQNQKAAFNKSRSEVFVLDGTAWERKYGEKEYVLTPVVKNIKEYHLRINSLNNEADGINKSKFHFIKVDLNDNSKSLLKKMNIIVPDYITDNVNVFLPEIDIDNLQQNNITFSFLNNYGSQNLSSNVQVVPLAIIYSEGFETTAVPGSDLSVSVNSVDCGWDDVSCKSKTGSWSIYSAGNGNDCYSDCTQYPNDMSTDIDKSVNINTSSYLDFFFKFWMWFHIGGNDEIYRYYDIGSGWVLSSTSYSGRHVWNLTGWNQESVSYSGSIPYYKWSFRFVSNAISSNEQGVYIDDIELSGTVNSIKDLSNVNNLKIFPNPSTGVFTFDNITEEGNVEIYDLTGRLMLVSALNKEQNTINLTNKEKGIYFYKIKNKKNQTQQGKLILE